MLFRYITATLGAALFVSCAVVSAGPANAADGEVLITQAKAVAGGVTPGDAPGFPVTISLPGSYKLAGNLSVPANLDGIDVNGSNANEVTIDLNGFRIAGPGATVLTQGTGIIGRRRSLTVRNGTIRAFRLDGILTHGAFMIIKDMRIIENGVAGVDGDGSYARIVNSTIALNKFDGIFCRTSCHVEGNIISANGASGVNITAGTVLGNTIETNGNYGIKGVGGVGVGNNTLVGNRLGQIHGSRINLHPNACYPQPCPN